MVGEKNMKKLILILLLLVLSVTLIKCFPYEKYDAVPGEHLFLPKLLFSEGGRPQKTLRCRSTQSSVYSAVPTGNIFWFTGSETSRRILSGSH